MVKINNNMQAFNYFRIVPRDADFLDRKTGSRGEIFFDEDSNCLRLYDGVNLGGYALLRADLENLEGTLGATVSTTPPVGVEVGTLWLDSKTGKLFVYYTDSNSSQWVQVASPDYGVAGAAPAVALNFPNNPTANVTTYTDGTSTWLWTGTVWEISPKLSVSFTNLNVNELITGNLLGNVTGTVSSLSNHGIDNLNDVTITTPSNAQVLAYNTTTSRWENLTLGAFTGGTIPNPVNISNTTVSTSSSTGALKVGGGVGIVDDLYIGGHVSIEDEYLELRTRSEIRFLDTDNSNYIGFKAPSNLTANKIWVLPTQDGDPGQFLQTDGSGNLGWASAGGAGGETSPGGSNTQIQFNNNGTFGGNASFTFTTATSTVNLITLVASGVLTVTNNTASTTANTGAVVVTGGIGVNGQINVAGNTSKFTSNTASTTTTTGAVVVTGGLGVGGQITVGGNVNINTDPTIASHATNKSYVDAKSLALAMAFGV